MNELVKVTGNEVVLPDETSVAAFFADKEQVTGVLENLAKMVRAQKADTSTAKGRKAIASLAYKVAQSKTFLDSQGKALNEEARAQIATVDAERRRIRDYLDALRDEAREPLDKWERAEAERKDALQKRLDDISEEGLTAASDPEAFEEQIARIKMIDTATFEEFEELAAAKKANVLSSLEANKVYAEERQRNERELAKLREQAAERERKEAEERAEREEKERKEREERETRERAEREKREAEERAAKAIRDSITAFERLFKGLREGLLDGAAKPVDVLIDAAETAALPEKADETTARLLGDFKAAVIGELKERKGREEEEAQRRRDEEAQRRAEEAAKERQRIADRERAKAEAERKKREADAEHRAKIARDITEALQPIPREQIAAALMDGRIPHIKVVI